MNSENNSLDSMNNRPMTDDQMGHHYENGNGTWNGTCNSTDIVTAENIKNSKMSSVDSDSVWKTGASLLSVTKINSLNGKFMKENGAGAGAGAGTVLPDVANFSKAPSKKVRLSVKQRAAYSVGHVFNDLCASMWFTYLLLYFNMVLNFSNGRAGVLMLIGQVADALATPFVGIASDKANTMKIFRYGRRKIWHLIGTICVLISFPFLFIPCLGCSNSSLSIQMVYYSFFIVVFQFGWAAAQVAHLSLIPDLTKNPNEKTELNALRNAFTVVASICVYLITWFVIGVQSSGPEDSIGIGPEDVDKFLNIAFIVSAIGLVFSVIFHLGIVEPKPAKIDEIVKVATQHSVEMNGQIEKEIKKEAKTMMRRNSMTWRTWLKDLEFYKVGILYMCTRLFVNLSQTFITLYLQESLKLPKAPITDHQLTPEIPINSECCTQPETINSIAIIPLVVYVSGFLASIIMKPLNKKAGRRLSFVLGVIFALAFCVWIVMGGNSASYTEHQLYAVAVLMGIGGTVMLVTCLSITADLIGENVQSGAFVYGAMSFADKLSNGIVVVIVQNVHVAIPSFYRNTLAFGSAVPSIVALITVFTLSNNLVNSTRIKPEESDDEMKTHAVSMSNGHAITNGHVLAAGPPQLILDNKSDKY